MGGEGGGERGPRDILFFMRDKRSRTEIREVCEEGTGGWKWGEDERVKARGEGDRVNARVHDDISLLEGTVEGGGERELGN